MAVSSISVTVAHAVSFLTRPFTGSYSASTLGKLQMILDANLTAHYAPTWSSVEPLRGSGRRCLTLSPECLPPRVIYAACIATGVQWFDWIGHLGGFEFDFLVDPGCVSIRVANNGSPSSGRLITVWSDEAPSPLHPSYNESALKRQANVRSKTFAQQLMEYDQEEDNRLFSMLADEMSQPTWMTPVVDRFPASVRSTSPLSTISNSSTHSRSSSRSSNSSGSFSSNSLSPISSEKKLSRRERARQTRVFVDTSKVDVTPYDGGKTTVLTGGVMLGGPKRASPSANTWRV